MSNSVTLNAPTLHTQVRHYDTIARQRSRPLETLRCPPPDAARAVRVTDALGPRWPLLFRGLRSIVAATATDPMRPVGGPCAADMKPAGCADDPPARLTDLAGGCGALLTPFVPEPAVLRVTAWEPGLRSSDAPTFDVHETTSLEFLSDNADDDWVCSAVRALRVGEQADFGGVVVERLS